MISNVSKRTTYRKLKTLIDNKLIKREHIIYGVPALYTLTHKGKKIAGVNKRENKFRLDQIYHDITVIDCAFYFMSQYKLKFDDITSEKELHSKHGFGSRPHVPDFEFMYDQQSIAVEVELSLKAKQTLFNNVQLNFINYDQQIWIIRKADKNLKNRLDESNVLYPNISIFYLEELTQNEWS